MWSPGPAVAPDRGYDRGMRSLSGAAALALVLLAPPPAARPAAVDDAYEKAAKAVQKAMGERDQGPLADALLGLRTFDGEPAARLVLSAAFRRDVPDFVLDAACDTLASFQSGEAADFFAKELERTRDVRRFALLEALGRLKNAYADE